ncbi:MAG: hypothetical protein R3F59_35145 [Myxococcota bacterium]
MTELGALAVGALVALGGFGALLATRIRRYTRLLSPAHFTEIAHALAERQATLRAGVPEPVVTREGVALVYTIGPDDDGAVAHHLSLSSPSGLPWSTASTIAAYVFGLGALPLDDAAMIDTGSPVRQARVRVAPDVAWQLVVPEPAEIPARISQAMVARAALPLRRQSSESRPERG